MATATELRSLLIKLSDAAAKDLALLWAQLDEVTVADGLMDVLPTLVDEYGDAAAAVTSDWYDEYRADVNVGGSFVADLAAPNLGAEALAGWGSQLAQSNWDSALALITGGLTKRVMNASRATVIDNTVRDPQARGWMRVGTPECGWCAMLISRGAVFRSRSTADFAAHDNCKCGCCPAWGRDQVASVRNEFVPTARRRSGQVVAADRERAKRWIDANLQNADGAWTQRV